MNTRSKDESTFSDETLSAYLDGEVSDETRRAIDEAQADMPGLDDRLNRMQELDHALITDDPAIPPGEKNTADPLSQAPSQLHSHGQDLPGKTERASNDGYGNVRQLRPRDKSRGKTGNNGRSWTTQLFPAAIAASLALIAGYGAGSQNQQAPKEALPTLIAQIDEQHPYFSLLEQSASGTEVSLGDDPSIVGRVALTYVNEGGQYCREFNARESGTSVHGVACRSNGQWQLGAMQQTRMASASASDPDGNTYAPVSDNTASAIEAYLDETMADDPLGRGAEEALIAKGWQ